MKKSSRANLGLLSDPEESETGHGIDSSDSLMNELGTTTSKLRGDSEEDQDDSERSSEDAIRSPKQGRKLFRRKDSSPVTQIEDSESRSKHRGTSQSGGVKSTLNFPVGDTDHNQGNAQVANERNASTQRRVSGRRI